MSLRPDRVELPGGGRVLLLPNPASSFLSFHGSLPAGVAAEAPGEEGVAEFLCRLLPSGTRRWTARQVAEGLEGLGATLEFIQAEDIVVFRGRCTRRAAAKVLAIAADCLTNPALPAKEVERVRAEILTDLERERDSTRERADRELLSLVYPDGHPYGRDPKADPERVKGIEPRALFEFHARAYAGPGLILGLSGDVDRVFVESTVARAFAGLPKGVPPPPPPAPGPAPAASRFVNLPHKSQVDVALGLQALSRSDPDYYALSLANLMFGVIGMYGRLGASVREDKGLAYYSYSRLRALRHGGHWGLFAGVNPERLEPALAAVAAELDRLRSEPFTDDEIETAKLHEVGGLIVNLERNAEVAGALHGIELHDLGLDYLERFPRIVNGLTREAILAATERYLRRRDGSLVVVGPVGGRTFSL